MSVKPSLQLKLGQQLTMTPQLQQAIRLLQLSSLDLQAEIQSALENNPLLERTEEHQEEVELDNSEVGSQQTEDKLPSDEVLAEKSWDEKTPYPSQSSGQPSDFEPQRAEETTLIDHLLWQMELTPLSERDRLIATVLIEAINDDGFLETPLEEIQVLFNKNLEIDASEVLAVLHRIQHFDPIGVGARDLQECLLIQLKQLPKETPYLELATQCVAHHLNLLGKKDYAALKRKLKVDMETLQEVIRCIQSLNPRPGSEIGTRTPDYVVPDAYVSKHQGRWVVELNPVNKPNIRINDHYSQLIRRADTSADNQFLKDQLQEARWFLKSLQNRHETLLKVVESIVEQQKEFLEHGDEYMKPMILHDVAQVINMHESTVSRVTTHKFLHTPRGTYELKYFFSSHVQTQSGEECSSTVIRALIKKLIAEENCQKPLSDNKLSALLAKQGIQVARRTVAKYRESMKIPPSNERKRLV